MEATPVNLGQFDIVKVATYVAAACAVITVATLDQILKPWGVPEATISIIQARIGSIAALAVLIVLVANTIKNQTPPPGTSTALIPTGSVPVVTAAPGTDTKSVAVADPRTVLQVTAANVAPPKQV